MKALGQEAQPLNRSSRKSIRTGIEKHLPYPLFDSISEKIRQTPPKDPKTKTHPNLLWTNLKETATSLTEKSRAKTGYPSKVEHQIFR